MSAARENDRKPKKGTKPRHERLEEALRANLAKRKAQARARREGATTSGNDGKTPGGDGE